MSILMVTWQSIFVRSPSPRACLYNTEYRLTMLNNEVHSECHTAFIHISLGRVDKFSADWRSFWAPEIVWSEQIVPTCDQAGPSGTCRWIHQEEARGCHVPFWDLLFPGWTFLCPLFVHHFVWWRIVEKHLFSATLPFFNSCRPISAFWGSRNATLSSLNYVPMFFVTKVTKLAVEWSAAMCLFCQPSPLGALITLWNWAVAWRPCWEILSPAHWQTSRDSGEPEGGDFTVSWRCIPLSSCAYGFLFWLPFTSFLVYCLRLRIPQICQECCFFSSSSYIPFFTFPRTFSSTNLARTAGLKASSFCILEMVRNCWEKQGKKWQKY